MHYQGKGLIFKGERITFRKGQGTVHEHSYVGVRNGILGIAPSLERLADEFVIDHNGPVYTCTARMAPASISEEEAATVVNDVRSSANRISKQPWHHPNYASVTNEELEELKRIIAQNKPFSDISADMSAAAAELYDKMLNDSNYTIYQPVIQRTWTAGSSYYFNQLYYQNIGRVHLSVNMPTELDLPDNEIGFRLPIENSTDGWRQYGWIKHYPEYAKGAGQKAVMSQDYEYGLWDLDLYPLAV